VEALSVEHRGAPSGAGIRTAQLRAVGTAFLRRRPLIVAPMMAATLIVLSQHSVPRPQLRALEASFAVVLGFFAYEAWRGGRRLVTARQLAISLFVTLVAVAFGCALTGGAGSPMLPLLFAPAVVTFAAFGRRAGAVMLVALAGAMGALWVLPAGVPFPPLSPAAHRSIAALAVVGAGVLSFIGVTGLSDAYANARATLDRAGETVIEAATARVEALEALGAGVAHELRNPLAALKGLVELVLEGREPDRAPRRLAVVLSEVARMESILEGYLSFSRPLGAFAPVPVDLAVIVREAADLIEARAERDGVELILMADPAVLPSAANGAPPGRPASVVPADPRRLKEAVLNLVLNALQATAPGGAIRVGSRRAADEACIFVEDTGRGMSPETLARLGEPFFSTRTGGVGLGVRLARQVAELHGGRLTYASTVGKGTQATLVLPVKATIGRD
jgi:signal transduction histidine kinase